MGQFGATSNPYPKDASSSRRLGHPSPDLNAGDDDSHPPEKPHAPPEAETNSSTLPAASADAGWAAAADQAPHRYRSTARADKASSYLQTTAAHKPETACRPSAPPSDAAAASASNASSSRRPLRAPPRSTPPGAADARHPAPSPDSGRQSTRRARHTGSSGNPKPARP